MVLFLLVPAQVLDPQWAWLILGEESGLQSSRACVDTSIVTLHVAMIPSHQALHAYLKTGDSEGKCLLSFMPYNILCLKIHETHDCLSLLLS